jgi:hypothetical protein
VAPPTAWSCVDAESPCVVQSSRAGAERRSTGVGSLGRQTAGDLVLQVRYRLVFIGCFAAFSRPTWFSVPSPDIHMPYSHTAAEVIATEPSRLFTSSVFHLPFSILPFLNKGERKTTV